ncbi:MAG: hypothetical protein ACRCXZ_05340 [Patescibacteria group bacterium]
MNTSIESILIQKLISWSEITKSLNMHKGVLGDRVAEFQGWMTILPLSTLYKLGSDSNIIGYDSPQVQAKAVFAALILIIDDVVDNSDENILSLFGTNLLNFGQKIPIFANNTLHDEAVILISEIVNFSLEYFDRIKFTFFRTALADFFAGVNEELTMTVNLILGDTVLFNTRIYLSHLQGAIAAVSIDLTLPWFDSNQEKDVLGRQLGEHLNAFLSLCNSEKTVVSEILNHEISSPLFILACESESIKPFEKVGEIDWYTKVANKNEFKERINSTKSHLIHKIMKILNQLECDSNRFFDSIELIYRN